MSGRFHYIGSTVQEILEEIGDDQEVSQRWPLLAALIKSVGDWIAKTEEAIDMDMEQQGDVRGDRAFDLAAAGALVDRVIKLMPDDLFPLGKKATIEKWHAMTGSNESPAYVGEQYPRDLWV